MENFSQDPQEQALMVIALYQHYLGDPTGKISALQERVKAGDPKAIGAILRAQGLFKRGCFSPTFSSQRPSPG